MINKRMIVSVSGLIGSGKDTIGEFLVEHHGFERMSFSSALKDAVASIFGWDRALVDGLTAEAREWRETPDEWWSERLDFGRQLTPRDILILIGTDVMRNKFHPDIWRLSLQHKIIKSSANIVVTDTRFLNELSLMREVDALVLGVWRRPPAWSLKYFYSGVEDTWRREVMGAAEPFSADLSNPNIQAIMLRCGHATTGLMSKPPHESEWQHLLWNDYDAVIDNSGTKDSTYTQVLTAMGKRFK